MFFPNGEGSEASPPSRLLRAPLLQDRWSPSDTLQQNGTGAHHPTSYPWGTETRAETALQKHILFTFRHAMEAALILNLPVQSTDKRSNKPPYLMLLKYVSKCLHAVMQKSNCPQKPLGGISAPPRAGGCLKLNEFAPGGLQEKSTSPSHFRMETWALGGLILSLYPML